MSSAVVVLPTYQEADNIAEVLHRVGTSVPDATLLVVDDSSPDGTADIAEQEGQESDKVVVIRRPDKAGLGSAYREAFAWAIDHNFELVVSMDADLSHDPSVLPTLLDAGSNGADLVIGSRYVPGGHSRSWAAHRRLLSLLGNVYARSALRLSARDVTSGFRAYSTTALRKLDLSTVSADGYGFQIEMAHRIEQVGGNTAEVPITFVDRQRGASKMSAHIIAEAFAMVTSGALADRRSRLAGALRHRAARRRR